MTVVLHNYLKTLDSQELVDRVKNTKQFRDLLTHLDLDKTLSVQDFVEYLLTESKKLLNDDMRKEGLIILKSVKSLLSLVPRKLHAIFYLQLAESFLLKNDYEGARKAVEKANDIAAQLEDPRLKIRINNMLFIIHRTVGKDKAMGYLLKSREIAEKNNFYENIVFCDVNIGLMHFFKNELNKAVERCKRVLDLITEKPYPNEKLLMPTDFFLQVFSDNPGLVVASKNKKTILIGVTIVLKALRQLKNDYEATRRLSILTSFLKLSEALVEQALVEIDSFIEEFPPNRKPLYYSAVASGIANYKEYQISLLYFEKALNFVKNANETEQRRIRKAYAYALSNILGISMLFDLDSSPQTTQDLKNLFVKIDQVCLIGDKGKKVEYRNAVADSDAVFSVDRKFLEERILVSLKDRYEIKSNIIKFQYQKGREDILENLELFTINAITHKDELESMLFVGTTMSDKDLKKQKRAFSGYQVLGHIVPTSIKSEKHIEDYSISFIYDLVRTPQRFKKIEILTTSENVNISYIPFFK
ncbi:MAG: hypothetical protein KAS63_04500 [Candidatus Heimdallarchaeota archaeon]|nr:hypothetical protein [Candidatus Heimdallarchaeota archaeon]MCK4954595.1 hypothetical protein [Candidatus Heimdallarchaeota archaeon]